MRMVLPKWCLVIRWLSLAIRSRAAASAGSIIAVKRCRSGEGLSIVDLYCSEKLTEVVVMLSGPFVKGNSLRSVISMTCYLLGN